MARVYGKEYPERPTMSVLSDLLGIPHFTTSNGSTVRKDFIEAVAGGLGVTVSPDANKDDILLDCIAAAQRAPRDDSYLARGTTITDRAIQAIIDGVTIHGVPNLRVQPQMPVVLEYSEHDAAELDDPFPEAFDPESVSDERTKRLVEVTARQGQDRFRSAVLEAYGNRCAVTGSDAVAALDAAHIVPYLGPGTNRVSNGLLLRADIHRLFDRGQLSVHEDTFRVILKGHLLATTYGELDGRVIRLPHRLNQRPALVALRDHRIWAGL